MKKKLLPIGSVVMLKGGQKRLMICGRIQTMAGNDVIYDYSGCFYPEGIVDPKKMSFFNADDIENIYFIGFQDPEGLALQKAIYDLGDLVVKDGKIIEAALKEAANDNGETS